ncbi:MAG: DUF4416 family protein [Candidatus Aminicenantia bacterium]
MGVLRKFDKVNLVVGIIYKEEFFLEKAFSELKKIFGEIDFESESFKFDVTDYYNKEMGEGLMRKFYSFKDLVSPEELPSIKIKTNFIEESLKNDADSSGRVVNIDPGILTPTSLIMATTKNYSHRIPLRDGIYAHLEFIFSKDSIKYFEWTYMDMRKKEYDLFYIEVRRLYIKKRSL